MMFSCSEQTGNHWDGVIDYDCAMFNASSNARFCTDFYCIPPRLMALILTNDNIERCAGTETGFVPVLSGFMGSRHWFDAGKAKLVKYAQLQQIRKEIVTDILICKENVSKSVVEGVLNVPCRLVEDRRKKKKIEDPWTNSKIRSLLRRAERAKKAKRNYKP
ncbi:hypothetical protein HN873_044476 [Arachis hypogaea]